MGQCRVVVLSTPEALAARAADEFLAACGQAVQARGRFAVALSGGSTPTAMLELLASRDYRNKADWRRVHVFWSDERCVPPEDPGSNFGMAKRALLDSVSVPGENVHRMRGEMEPEAGAADYSRRLLEFFDGAPIFDLVFLGLGPDGHTASLFPGTSALHASGAPCVANRVDAGVTSPWRLTFTYATINAARSVTFLVESATKKAILKQVLEGPRDPDRLPAQGVAPKNGSVTWLVDAAAAADLREALSS